MVYCIGESLYDIVFEEGQPVWGMPGGGMLNVSVSLGHLGVPVELISEFGNDRIAEDMLSFLKRSNVGINYVVKNKNNSTLAIAFLNEDGDAKYQFYMMHPETSKIFKVPEFMDGDIIMFGSMYSIEERNRANIQLFINEARKKNVIILYDPNIRSSKVKNNQFAIKYIKENISAADIVRGSDEDFDYILKIADERDAYSFVKRNGTNKLIYTCGSEGAILFTNKASKKFQSLPVEIVSTIGAGDSFNAGVISTLCKLKRIPLNDDEWNDVMITGLSFAAEVCGSRNNYISR